MNFKCFSPSGILDGQNTNQLRREITDTVEGGTNIIRVDFKNVSFINSSAIGALVATLKFVRASGGEIFLYSLNNQVKIIFEMTRMDQVFVISDDRAEIEAVSIPK